MTSHTELTDKYTQALKSKYSVLGHFSLLAFDSQFPVLEQRLSLLKKDVYSANERIIIEHFDTDYYLPNFPYGLSIFNLFSIFRKLDIPLFTMLIVTNSFGISQEVNQLSPDPNDRPTVIETFISNKHYTDCYQNCDLDADSITIAALCMMGQSRVHRSAVYQFIKAQIMDQVAVSVNPK
jgi:hypothetical protein